MTNAELQAQLAAALAENARLKAAKTPKMSMKVSEKKALSIYGLGRFPATFYKRQWRKLLAMAAEIEAFIVAHEAELIDEKE